MAELENREKVLLLTDSYRIVGTMRLGPDGSLWDFKHHQTESFVTVFDAQCFCLSDGKRMFDSAQMELSKHAIVAVFKQQDCAFVRKEA